MKKSSVFVRHAQPAKVTTNPFPLRNLQEVSDEQGNAKLVEVEPVSRSLACEFSVGENALKGSVVSTSSRISVDPVDVENFLSSFDNA